MQKVAAKNFNNSSASSVNSAKTNTSYKYFESVANLSSLEVSAPATITQMIEIKQQICASKLADL